MSLFLRGMEPCVDASHEQCAADYIADSGGNEIGQKHPCDSDFGPGHYSGRNEEHVGDGVLIAQSNECHYRQPASGHFFNKRMSA